MLRCGAGGDARALRGERGAPTWRHGEPYAHASRCGVRRRSTPVTGPAPTSCRHVEAPALARVSATSRATRLRTAHERVAEARGGALTLLCAQEVDRTGETTYYDSVSGLPLFIAPHGRTFAAFEAESRSHGWPSFRDEEVVWENVRVLPDGECVSLVGTHLGHNLPDRKGNRYCINLVSVCALPPK